MPSRQTCALTLGAWWGRAGSPSWSYWWRRATPMPISSPTASRWKRTASAASPPSRRRAWRAALRWRLEDPRASLCRVWVETTALCISERPGEESPAPSPLPPRLLPASHPAAWLWALLLLPGMGKGESGRGLEEIARSSVGRNTRGWCQGLHFLFNHFCFCWITLFCTEDPLCLHARQVNLVTDAIGMRN